MKELGKQTDKICKTVCQYNKETISSDDMKKLQEIAEDYCKVKNYIYTRYSGKGSLAKLYPGYTIQNEMTKSGLREKIGMPSVYFYLAVFDALGDIKCQWTRTKSKVSELLNKNETLSSEEKHYLRFLLKSPNAFEAVLNHRPVCLIKEMEIKHNELAAQVDIKKMHNYLRRQIRKYQSRQYHTDVISGFFTTERAYRYADHGIYITTKQNRKRVFVPLTDNNQYKNQLYVRLYPETGDIELKAPVNVQVHCHPDYINQVGVSLGIYTMLTTDKGHVYGEHLGKYQLEYAEWIREQTNNYNRHRADNPGRKKYNAKRKRYVEQLHSYINHELNRFLQTEKPKTVYMVKLPRPSAGGVNKKINNCITLWQRGYIRKRIQLKCREQSVEFTEVLGKGISSECSRCGANGIKKDGMFRCPNCGYAAEDKMNTSKNVLKRGIDGKIIRS
ncbi:transposase [Lachnospiraceae bacterium WCA-9-b2]|uniref:Transposase n=1 Tax=Sporofaciens musculi TaxID=2681861 RepID=A0A7X3SHD3_9FIRM|nr:zinc ribbon domain-containing protein [Sporofaciens musculi]MXP74289.1 transposase [Sporofaciens musculi]